MNIFESAEDYLETILILGQKLEHVRSIDIANYMGYSKPSISIAMKRLKESKYIEIDNSSYITLTSSGYEVASKIYERHLYLTKWLMSIGVDEYTAKKDACKIEHDLSEETFKAIKKHFK